MIVFPGRNKSTINEFQRALEIKRHIRRIYDCKDTVNELAEKLAQHWSKFILNDIYNFV